jgi:WD40 repeat protein/serine/threonine protein kinase
MGGLSARAIFDHAMELPASERRAYVDAACRDDATLRENVLELLAAHEVVGKFMEAPTVAGLVPLAEGPGTVIGRYKLLELIGEGGFGSVFMAEQRDPVVRRVALKIIKLGMDTKAVIARFDAERQALAMMDHPHIARVLDAGATANGRPYFVMELVKGEPITAFCDRQRLSITERLGLLLQVCQAVQHAHQKGVIHRDLKPGNVLVAIQDGQAFAKVIDFGIAKATAARLTEKTLFTEHRQLIGTPEYMSPEQAEGSLDIDTRTDVYSLGVLMYEMLTGSTPFDPKRLRSLAYAEIQRVIREEEPPAPSTRLSALETLPDVAAHRHAEPVQLAKSIRGDLDWIVMKALEKHRARRYETANALANDIRRHISGEAVTAAPPSTVYRIRKFVNKHRRPVIATILLMATLLGGTIGTTTGWIAAYQRANDAAKATKNESIAKQRADANAERYRAELSVTNIERGRLLGITGNFAAADQLIWSEHAAAPSDLSYWALWELYSRMPICATLGDHPREVRYVAARSDGATVATCSQDEVHIWDAHSWRCTHVVKLDSDLRGLEYTPDGALVVAATNNGQVAVLRAVSGEVLSSISLPRAWGIAVPPTGPAPWPLGVVGGDELVHMYLLGSDGTLHPDGMFKPAQRWNLSQHTVVTINPARTLLVGGSIDGEVHAWRMDTREEIWRVKEHGGAIGSIAFSPDGSLMVTGGNDRSALFYDVSGLAIAPAAQHSMGWDNGTVRSLQFSKDGRFLLAAGYWWTEVWDVARRARSTEFVRCQERAGCAVWIEGDTKILATGSANYAHVWEALPNGHRRRYTAHSGGTWGLALSPKEDLLASAGNDGTIRLWHWPSMEPAFDLPKQEGRIRITSFTKDGRTLLTAGADGVLRLWDLESRHCRLMIDNPENLYHEYYGALFSPDGSEIITSVRDRKLRFYDAQIGTLKSVVEGPANSEHVSTVISDDGRWLASASSLNTTVSIWKYPECGSPVTDITLGAAGWQICWLREPNRLAAGTWDSVVEVWDTQANKALAKLSGHTQLVVSLAIGPRLSDGTCMLVSGSFDGTIKLWNTTSGACLLTLSPDDGAVTKVVCTPDGRTIISAHEDGTLAVWDLGHYEPHIRSAAGFH